MQTACLLEKRRDDPWPIPAPLSGPVGRRVSAPALLLMLATALIARPALPAQAAPRSSAQSEPSEQATEDTQTPLHPLAIVPLDNKLPGGAIDVQGELKVVNGRAYLTGSGSIASGSSTVPVTIPYRGTLRICASTMVKLATDSSVPGAEVPGLLVAMDHGAIEASFANVRNSDFILTPDFRILVGGPGAANLKVRLGPRGDTCVDNAGLATSYILVTSVFDGADYRVQTGQRVMFQHGSVHEVVDQEKEPCGCPPETRGGNDFPLAQSEGLAPLLHPAPPPQGQVGHEAQSSEGLVYNATERVPKPAETSAAAAPAALPVSPTVHPPQAPSPPPAKKRGFFKRLGGFFRKVFGAD